MALLSRNKNTTQSLLGSDQDLSTQSPARFPLRHHIPQAHVNILFFFSSKLTSILLAILQKQSKNRVSSFERSRSNLRKKKTSSCKNNGGKKTGSRLWCIKSLLPPWITRQTNYDWTIFVVFKISHIAGRALQAHDKLRSRIGQYNWTLLNWHFFPAVGYRLTSQSQGTAENGWPESSCSLRLQTSRTGWYAS